MLSIFPISLQLKFGARQTKAKVKPLADFSPILADKVDFKKIQYPVLMSPKMDGHRGFVKNGTLMSRGEIPIPNMTVQRILGRTELEGMDGELIAGSVTAHDVLSKTGSLMRRKNGTDNFGFYVFDIWNTPDVPFKDRVAALKARVAQLPKELKKYVHLVPQTLVKNKKEVLALEKKWLAQGYAGAILRNPDAPYLFTRSTMTDQAFMKLKRFEDAEAQIIDVLPLAGQSDVAESLRESGQLKKGEKIPLAAGRYKVKDLKSGVEFHLGVGDLSLEERKKLWKKAKRLIGQVVKYKHFPVGVNPKTNIPRHASFLAFRDDHDMPKDLSAIAAKGRERLQDFMAEKAELDRL